MVLVHHALLTVPYFADNYRSPDELDRPLWVAFYTPLHLLWAGSEAVYIFFILSGFVLVMPFLAEQRRPDWVRYYPQRLSRLYLPVWVAILLGYAWLLLIPREASLSPTWWLAQHDVTLSPPLILKDASLAAPSWANSPLWSLKYEVAFSILLPAYVWAARRLFRVAVKWSFLSGVVAIAIIYLGALLDNPWMKLLPMFAIGSIMAAVGGHLVTLGRGLRTPVWLFIVSAGCGLLLGEWAPLGDGYGTAGQVPGSGVALRSFAEG